MKKVRSDIAIKGAERRKPKNGKLQKALFVTGNCLIHLFFWAIIWQLYFCCFWCLIFLKACTHLKFESFPYWDKFFALSWSRGFLNTGQFLSLVGEDRGVSSRPQGRGPERCPSPQPFENQILSPACLVFQARAWSFHVLVTYISEFGTCLKRICSGRNSLTAIAFIS